jgi:hypothetical protein
MVYLAVNEFIFTRFIPNKFADSLANYPADLYYLNPSAPLPLASTGPLFTGQNFKGQILRIKTPASAK